MNVHKLLASIETSEAVITTERTHIKLTKQAIAEHRCPFMVGDRVMTFADKKGKRTEQVIASISYRNWDPGYDFKVYKIKTNGELYANPIMVFHVANYIAAE